MNNAILIAVKALLDFRDNDHMGVVRARIELARELLRRVQD